MTRNYQRQASVTGMLNQLQWPTLAARREYTRLIIFYKIINNCIAIPIPSYVIPSARISRHHHPGSFITIAATTNTYGNSFIPRTLVAWNNLPISTRALGNLEDFKTTLATTLF